MASVKFVWFKFYSLKSDELHEWAISDLVALSSIDIAVGHLRLLHSCELFNFHYYSDCHISYTMTHHLLYLLKSVLRDIWLVREWPCASCWLRCRIVGSPISAIIWPVMTSPFPRYRVQHGRSYPPSYCTHDGCMTRRAHPKVVITQKFHMHWDQSLIQLVMCSGGLEVAGCGTWKSHNACGAWHSHLCHQSRRPFQQ